ncbi:hypothetical protein ACWGNE_19245 [Streptomyces xiamenensis]
MTLERTRRLLLFALLVFVLYAVIAEPGRAADFAAMTIEAVSGAALGVGRFVTSLVH